MVGVEEEATEHAATILPPHRSRNNRMVGIRHKARFKNSASKIIFKVGGRQSSQQIKFGRAKSETDA